MIFCLSTFFTEINALWVTVLISILALILSTASFIKNIQLERKMEAQNKPKLELYIKNKFKQEVYGNKFYFIELIITNVSKVLNSLKNIELEVFLDNKEKISSIILNNTDNSKYVTTKLPINIEAGTCKSIFLSFNCNYEIFNSKKISKYKIIVTDSNNYKYENDFTIMNEVILDNAK